MTSDNKYGYVINHFHARTMPVAVWGYDSEKEALRAGRAALKIIVTSGGIGGKVVAVVQRTAEESERILAAKVRETERARSAGPIEPLTREEAAQQAEDLGLYLEAERIRQGRGRL